jgi:glycosyltransferase involved in cell wall biosynthesis
MRVCFIGTDKSILKDSEGDSRRRQILYAPFFDELLIVVFTLRSDRLDLIKIGNLTVIPTNSLARWLYVWDAVKILLRSGKVDVISTQSPFLEAISGLIVKIFRGARLNVQLHVDLFDNRKFRLESIKNFIYFLISLVTLRAADSVRAGSRRLVRGTKYFVAQVPMNVDFFWSGVHSEKFNQIVSVGRLVKQKNFRLLLNVFADVCKVIPDMKLVIVGDGPEKANLANQSRDLEIDKNVFFLGPMKPSEYKGIFAASDVYVSTSNYEGWGMAMTEALSAGLPVVTTDTGCAGELVVDGKVGGWVVPVGDRNAMFIQLQVILSEKKFADRLVVAAQKEIREKFNQEILADKFVRGLKNTA